MSYVLRADASLEACLDYIAQVRAGLGTLPQLEPLAAPWTAMRGYLRDARDARDDARDALTAANARLRVRDAAWDGALTSLSGHAHLAAGKNEEREPYASLFGGVKANDAVKLGHHKASAFGMELLAKVEAQGHPSLKGPARAFKEAQGALLEAGEARVEARAALGPHDVERSKLIDAIEALIAATEVGILSAFPGRRDLVRAILAPPRSAGRRRREPDDEAPARPAPVAPVDVDDLVDEPA